MHAVWLKSPDQLDGDPMTRLKDGQQFGRFQITGALGRGGMAAVYRAYEPRLDREVALKVLSSDLTEQEGFAERFEREARLIAKLEHPNIVPVYASGIEDGTPWIALRFVSGGSLQERLESDPPKRAEGLDIFRAVASGLDFAHRAGVLHRDIKPQNVLVGLEGAVYLADFGIARLLEGNTAQTAVGSVLGTPQYMAPEQAEGKPLTAACDRYAFAVMVYRWLAGQVPFDADTPYAVLLKHIQSPIPVDPLEQYPPAVTQVVMKGMAKQPEDRWESCVEMMDRLATAMNDNAPCMPTIPHGPVRTQREAGPTKANHSASGAVTVPHLEAATVESHVAGKGSRSKAWMIALLALIPLGAILLYFTFSGRIGQQAHPFDPFRPELSTPATPPQPATVQEPATAPSNTEPVASWPVMAPLQSSEPGVPADGPAATQATPAHSDSPVVPDDGTVPSLPEVSLAGSLWIDVANADAASQARIKILNIAPVYYPGISLPYGKYQIEVSAPGYRTHREWIELDQDTLRRPVALVTAAVDGDATANESNAPASPAAPAAWVRSPGFRDETSFEVIGRYPQQHTRAVMAGFVDATNAWLRRYKPRIISRDPHRIHMQVEYEALYDLTFETRAGAYRISAQPVQDTLRPARARTVAEHLVQGVTKTMNRRLGQARLQ